MTFWTLQSLPRAWKFGVAWWETQTYPHSVSHQPAPFFPPSSIQTHSHAFTYLLCPPHEELKIDDSTTEGVEGGEGWERRMGMEVTRKHRANQRWEEEKVEERKKYKIARINTSKKKELLKWGRRKSMMYCTLVAKLSTTQPCLRSKLWFLA